MVRNSNIPNNQDRFFCSFLYTGLFFGFMTWVPLIWIVVANLRKIYLKDFIKYHCYQAILFNMIALFLPVIVNKLILFLSNLLSILVVFDNSIKLIASLTAWLTGIYYILIKVVALYAIIWTARGKYTYIPPISQAVNMLLR